MRVEERREESARIEMEVSLIFVIVVHGLTNCGNWRIRQALDFAGYA